MSVNLLQMREDLRRARSEGSRQRARELQWELKAAQLTAAGLQEQVLSLLHLLTNCTEICALVEQSA